MNRIKEVLDEKGWSIPCIMATASDISLEEVSVALKEVLESRISLSRKDLIRETARLFGYARLGTIVKSSMQQGIEKAIQRGFAKEENERIILT